MTRPNATNERIKREYFHHLRESRGRDEGTIDGIAKSLARFEEATRAKDFKRFHRDQAVAFKARLTTAVNEHTGKQLSKATVLAALRGMTIRSHATRARLLWPSSSSTVFWQNEFD